MAEATGSEVLVGRQPIMDRSRSIVGYELLYRRADGSIAETGADRRTASVLGQSATGIGLDQLVGEGLAFVNASPYFLVGEEAVPLPPERTVLEIPAQMEITQELLDGCRRLSRQGFSLALDDLDLATAKDHPLLDNVVIAKLDVKRLAEGELRHLVALGRARGLTMVALRVENEGHLRQTQQLGFDWFQGYFLSMPETVSTKSISPRQATCLNLLSQLSDDEMPVDDVEAALQTDIGLAYRVLRSASIGSREGMKREISSLRDAVVMLGQKKLASLLTLMMLADDAAGSDSEQMMTALIRARMCERLCEQARLGWGSEGFTVGLLSSLELLLHSPLPEVLASFPLKDGIRQAVLGHEGKLGEVLANVIAYERGYLASNLVSTVNVETVEEIYLESLVWAHGASSTLVPEPQALAPNSMS